MEGSNISAPQKFCLTNLSSSRLSRKRNREATESDGDSGWRKRNREATETAMAEEIMNYCNCSQKNLKQKYCNCSQKNTARVEPDELFLQLTHARLYKEPYKCFGDWLDINLWFKIASELSKPSKALFPSIDDIISDVRYYRKSYDDEPDLNWLKNHSLRRNLEIVFGLMTNRGCLRFDRVMVIVNADSGLLACKDEGSHTSNSLQCKEKFDDIDNSFYFDNH